MKSIYLVITIIILKYSFTMPNYNAYLCKDGIIPTKHNRCDEITQSAADVYLISSETRLPTPAVSIVIETPLDVMNVFTCKNFYDNFHHGKRLFDCKKIMDSCEKYLQKYENKGVLKEFIEWGHEISDDHVHNEMKIYKVLILKVSNINLHLGYYFLDAMQVKFKPFHLIIFQTETHRYLYRMQTMYRYIYRLVFALYRRNDLRYKMNLDYAHENNLFKERSLKSSFIEIRKLFHSCSYYKTVYSGFAGLLSRDFFYYFLPMFDLHIRKNKYIHMKFHEFRIWFKPKVFEKKLGLYKRFRINRGPISNVSFIEKPKTSEDYDIYYENKDKFQNEKSYLEHSANEHSYQTRQLKSNLFKNSYIDLYHSHIDDGEKEDTDFARLS